MKKILYLILIFYPWSVSAVEKTKEEKVAKYIIENIQKDYVACYSFYKVGAASFKKSGKEKTDDSDKKTSAKDKQPSPEKSGKAVNKETTSSKKSESTGKEKAA